MTSNLWDAADQVQQIASACTGLDGFVYVGRPPADCCDFVGVWAQTVTPVGSENFPQAPIGATRCRDITWAVEFHVLLLRSCWPTAQESRSNPFPDGASKGAASEELYVEAWDLLCCLVQEQEASDLLPWPHGRVQWNSLQPSPPQGDCAGFEIIFTAEVPRCCWSGSG